MALRSRSRTATVSSGPGRGPASDGRIRDGRPPVRGRTRARHRHESAEELRRRAEVLFPERPESPGRAALPELPERLDARQGWGTGPPDPPEEEDERAPAPVGQDSAPVGGTAEDAERRLAGESWRMRTGLALWERMPVWLQTRCGLERRSVVALGVLLVVAAVFAVQHFWTGRTQSVQAPEAVRAVAPFGEGKPGEGEFGAGKLGGRHSGRTGVAGSAASAGPSGAPRAANSAGAEIVVDVSGKVRQPGIQRLPAGSRVIDALRAAGGVKPGTNTDGLNRARFLVDGEQVVVGGPAVAQAPGPAGATAGGRAGAVPAAPVALNTATADQLESLPGVGPVLAQHIVDYRTQHGGFRSVDELRQVNGIGDRRFADLRKLVRP
ncbi:helix-hairpin-helix domain-containing protein [Streptomyces sp. NPDC101152]|uniref:helix-hairpin-helix domain-containing protein n=1 Tax=Streptomyces sp. NPDC101152 TaxID=3366116 RepID=UPI00381A7ED7